MARLRSGVRSRRRAAIDVTATEGPGRSTRRDRRTACVIGPPVRPWASGKSNWLSACGAAPPWCFAWAPTVYITPRMRWRLLPTHAGEARRTQAITATPTSATTDIAGMESRMQPHAHFGALRGECDRDLVHEHRCASLQMAVSGRRAPNRLRRCAGSSPAIAIDRASRQRPRGVPPIGTRPAGAFLLRRAAAGRVTSGSRW
jgi:hypothetical protein